MNITKMQVEQRIFEIYRELEKGSLREKANLISLITVNLKVFECIGGNFNTFPEGLKELSKSVGVW